VVHLNGSSMFNDVLYCHGYDNQVRSQDDERLDHEPGFKEMVLSGIMLDRLGTPDDIAYCATYLASDESAWTNGASLVIDGGISVNYF